MAVKYLYKNSTVAGKAPAASDLTQREIAMNTADSLLYALNTSGAVVNLNPSPYPVYNGTTLYKSNQTIRFATSGVTDANGRIVFITTKDGTTTGPAIFSKIFSINTCGVAGGTNNVSQYPYSTVEAVAAKSITIRSLMGISALITLGPTMQFSGSGVTHYIEVVGAP
jgi:hypothetical protein